MYSTVIGKTSSQFNASSLPSLSVFNVKIFLSFFVFFSLSYSFGNRDYTRSDSSKKKTTKKKKCLHALVDKMSQACMPSSPFSSYLLYTEDNRRTMLPNFITFFKVHFRFNYTYYSWCLCEHYNAWTARFSNMIKTQQ